MIEICDYSYFFEIALLKLKLDLTRKVVVFTFFVCTY